MNELDKELKELEDKCVTTVAHEFIDRSREGIRKYGGTLEGNPAGSIKFLQDVKEELMDALLYVEKVKVVQEKLLLSEMKVVYRELMKLHARHRDNPSSPCDISELFFQCGYDVETDTGEEGVVNATEEKESCKS